MSNIGILGGTFDPPHRAHIAMARKALDEIPLEKVLFAPAPQPPHKNPNDVTPYELRKKMVAAAIADCRGMELSLLEESSKGPSYTFELLARLGRAKNDSLFLILGADMASDLPNWKEPRTIAELATLVVFPRTGYSSRIAVDGDLSVVLFETPVIDVSSSEIRERYRRGQPIADQVADVIHKFILDNSVYS